MTKIKFGTSGWRAIIADEFTFANVRLATEAIGRCVKRRNPSPTLLVGYDTRFASEDFGREVARVLSSQNIRAKLCLQAVPTPGVAFTIMQQKLDGAINITASHNPGEYNGLKVSTADGAPALPEVTSEIETEIVKLQESIWEFTAKPNDQLIESIDIGPAYLRDLATKVDIKKEYPRRQSTSRLRRAARIRRRLSRRLSEAAEHPGDGAPHVRGHVPEKDGILACLLITEMVASRGKSLKKSVKGSFLSSW